MSKPYSATLQADMLDHIRSLEQQLRDMKAMRDEAGRRYVVQVQECSDKDKYIAELEAAARHASVEGEKDAATIDRLRASLTKYGGHLGGCADPFTNGQLKCDCGYAEALEAK